MSPCFRKAAQGQEELLRQHRRQAEREFVDHQHLRLLHQAAAHGQHLLLAAGEGGRLLLAAFFQAREQVIDAFQVLLLAACGRASSTRPSPGSLPPTCPGKAGGPPAPAPGRDWLWHAGRAG